MPRRRTCSPGRCTAAASLSHADDFVDFFVDFFFRFGVFLDTTMAGDDDLLSTTATSSFATQQTSISLISYWSRSDRFSTGYRFRRICAPFHRFGSARQNERFRERCGSIYIYIYIYIRDLMSPNCNGHSTASTTHLALVSLQGRNTMRGNITKHTCCQRQGGVRRRAS
jgi:hypothetical protein